MAKLSTVIRLSGRMRPALYRYDDESNATTVLVHTYIGASEFVIEFENGDTATANAGQLTFLDSEDEFAGYAWTAMLERYRALRTEG